MKSPSPPLQQIQAEEDRYQLPTYSKLPLSIERGEGCWIWDGEGNRYLDLYGGHAVVSTGHCHPRVVEALNRQAGQLIFYSNVAYNSTRARVVSKLVEAAGEPYYQAFLTNSGGESNENAIKLARALTGRREVISLKGSFHGRMYGCLSATGFEKYSRYLNTPVPEHRVLPPEEAAGAVSSRTAAVLVEPIQSMGGVRVLPAELLAELRDACRRQGALLVFDEVQTGVGRTGRFLYSGASGVFADVVTLAKGVASGFPAGAVLLTEQLARQVKVGDLGATFGGGPLACAALGATLDVLAEEGLAENAARIGDYLMGELALFEAVEEVRGCGLLLGLRPAGGTAKDLQKTLLDRRILTGTSEDPGILRLMPPLTLSRTEADLFLEALKSL